MPANLPPQFFALSAKLKEVKTSEEKISILEEMLAICPKHKGTEKVQKDLKSKIAKLKRQKPKKIKREILYSIPKEGAGQVVIIGPTNSGKSSLLNALTNAKAKVAPYPFTTQIPQPAMMRYENILIQLVDTPPLSRESPGWLKSLMMAADGLIAVFDLANLEVKKEVAETSSHLPERSEGREINKVQRTPPRLASPVSAIEDLKEILKEWNLSNKKILFLGNKIDLKKVETQYKIKTISCATGAGIEELRKEIFDLLEIVRIYSKPPGKEADFEHPFIAKRNTKLIELAKEIGENLASSFKYARLLRKDSQKIKIVGKNYLLKDQDIIEIHT